MGVFDNKVAETLIPEFLVMSTFYNLPKTYKGLNPLKGRPIILGIGSLNKRLGQWLDKQLQPIVTKLPSYLKDTNQLLNIVGDLPWDSQYKWVTCDVASFYSSIPHKLAMNALCFYLEHYTSLVVEYRMYVLDVLEYLLTHNFFIFYGGLLSI